MNARLDRPTDNKSMNRLVNGLIDLKTQGFRFDFQ